MAMIARRTRPTTKEKRKKLFPSRRYSRHGSAIAARFRTMQSVKMNLPREPTHKRTTMIATTRIPAMMSNGTAQLVSQSLEPVASWLIDRKFQSPFPKSL